MFLNIDGKDINAIYISTMRKEYENDSGISLFSAHYHLGCDPFAHPDFAA